MNYNVCPQLEKAEGGRASGHNSFISFDVRLEIMHGPVGNSNVGCIRFERLGHDVVASKNIQSFKCIKILKLWDYWSE